jgi:hypothetical protein
MAKFKPKKWAQLEHASPEDCDSRTARSRLASTRSYTVHTNVPMQRGARPTGCRHLSIDSHARESDTTNARLHR